MAKLRPFPQHRWTTATVTKNYAIFRTSRLRLRAIDLSADRGGEGHPTKTAKQSKTSSAYSGSLQQISENRCHRIHITDETAGVRCTSPPIAGEMSPPEKHRCNARRPPLDLSADSGGEGGHQPSNSKTLVSAIDGGWSGAGLGDLLSISVSANDSAGDVGSKSGGRNQYVSFTGGLDRGMATSPM